jgi:hypothetical protein
MAVPPSPPRRFNSRDLHPTPCPPPAVSDVMHSSFIDNVCVGASHNLPVLRLEFCVHSAYVSQWLYNSHKFTYLLVNGNVSWLVIMWWDYVSELRSQTGLLFIPRVICEHGEPWLWCCWLGITTYLTTSPTSRSIWARRGNGRRSNNFAYQYLKCLKSSLTCHKILRHWTSGFTIHPKKVELWTFYRP